MNFVSLALAIIIIIALCAVVYWFGREAAKETGFVLSGPLKIVVYALIAVLVILVLADFAGMGPGWFRGGGPMVVR